MPWASLCCQALPGLTQEPQPEEKVAEDPIDASRGGSEELGCSRKETACVWCSLASSAEAAMLRGLQIVHRAG